MNIRQRQVGDVTILDVTGKITIGVGDVAIRDAVQLLFVIPWGLEELAGAGTGGAAAAVLAGLPTPFRALP